MSKRVSKSQFKPEALRYFREVQKTGREIVITERGEPVLKIVPYRLEPDQALAELRGSVVRFDDPTEPVGLDDWNALE